MAASASKKNGNGSGNGNGSKTKAKGSGSGKTLTGVSTKPRKESTKRNLKPATPVKANAPTPKEEFTRTTLTIPTSLHQWAAGYSLRKTGKGGGRIRGSGTNGVILQALVEFRQRVRAEAPNIKAAAKAAANLKAAQSAE